MYKLKVMTSASVVSRKTLLKGYRPEGLAVLREVTEILFGFVS